MALLKPTFLAHMQEDVAVRMLAGEEAGVYPGAVALVTFMGGIMMLFKAGNKYTSMPELPEIVPQLSFKSTYMYPHVGVPRALSGSRKELRAKLKKGVVALLIKLRKVKFDRTQHVSCSNALKGAFVGYYAAPTGLSFNETETVERLWRTVFRGLFRARRDWPCAHFYGGPPDGVGDSLHGRHCLVDAVAALRATCTRALASPVDSTERAAARSALARRCRFWGCTSEPLLWLGSLEHRRTAVVVPTRAPDLTLDRQTPS